MCPDFGMAEADSVESPSTCTPLTALDSRVRQSTSHQRLLCVIRPAFTAMSPARCGGTTLRTSPRTPSHSPFSPLPPASQPAALYPTRLTPTTLVPAHPP